MTKKTTKWTVESAAIVIAMAASFASADITISQSADPASTYATTLNFDEPGGPTGVVAPDSWAGIGLVDMQAGDGTPNVNEWGNIVGPWIGEGNSFFGNFGVFMTFGDDLTNFSGQVWDPSGAPPFGGAGIFVYNDGAEIANLFIEPAWGGIGDSWIDVSATDGMVFDEIRIVGFGFDPSTFVDNLSWNAVPTPSGLAVLGLGGIVMSRRRR
jgi:hypothetical protein